MVQIEFNDYLTWGAFTYPFTFLVTELTNRFYGPKIARRVVCTGFVLAVILAFLWMNRQIAFASSAAFLIGQLMDISVFNRLRRSSWWVAPAGASMSASLLDTMIFFPLAFMGGDVPWFKLGLADFSVKLLMDSLLLLPFRLFLWRNGRGRVT